MKSDALRWLWAVSGKQKRNIAALTLVQALHGASGVFYALLLRSVVDAAVGQNYVLFRRSALYTLLLVAAQLALRALLRWLSELSKSDMENTFKSRLFHQLMYKDYAAVSAVHSAEWNNRFTNDTKVVADNMVEILPGLVGMTVKLICALVMLIVIDARIAAVLIPCGVLLLVFSWLFRRVLKRLHKGVQEQDGKLRILLQERLSAMPVLRSFAAEKASEAEAEEKMAAHKAARMRKNRFSNLCNIGFGAAIQGMTLFGVLWCGYGIMRGTVTFGTLTAITQLITQIQAPFGNISAYLPRYYAMLASAERLMEIEDYADESEGESLSLSEIKAYYADRFASVELKDAAFTYYPAAETLGELSKDSQPAVLSGLSFSLRKGETVAFTGQSGCGKSTVLKLLLCLYPLDSGKLLLRDRAGQPAPLTAAWRRLFAYVPQGNFLMSGTVREAVSFASPDRARDDDALFAALDLACADFIRDLENGLDTLLGERGSTLSEGQMQRIAIARAVFSESPILFLDEATSALDTETEKKLLENIRRMTDKTVVIVTHRPAVLSICDRVLHFGENGVIES